MKHRNSIVAFLLFFSFSASAQTDQKEIAAIAQTVRYYLDGGTFGDSIQFSKAFAPQGQMLYMRNDTLKIVSLSDFMNGFRNTGK